MDETKIDQLKRLVERLQAGEEPTRVRQEARAFLATVPQDEVVIVEDVLVEAGLALRDLRPSWMPLAEDGCDGVPPRPLPPSHPLAMLLADHERMLGTLDDLEHINRRLQTVEAPHTSDTAALADLAQRLAGFGRHLRCEEQALYPVLAGQEFDACLQALTREHNEIREAWDQLGELAQALQQDDVVRIRIRLDQTVGQVIQLMRDHIRLENTTLYPSALRLIRNPRVWSSIRRQYSPGGEFP